MINNNIYLEKKYYNNLLFFFSKTLPNHIAIAVSGGIDSMALLCMTSKWCKENIVTLTILTVDHNLRENAKKDALFVKNKAQMLNHECIILSWNNYSNNYSNIQNKAREGRYNLMTEICNKLGIKFLLTAHHMDDIVENFLFRKNRKSGILGLSFNNLNYWNDVAIIRPLHSFKKSQLKSYLEQEKWLWVDDESNYNNKYTRTRIRQYLTKLSQKERVTIYNEINQVNEKAQYLNDQLIKALAEIVNISSLGIVFFNITSYNVLEYEIKVYLLHYLLTIVSGLLHTPRYRNSKHLISLIDNGLLVKNTLHSCVIESAGEYIVIYKELNKIYDGYKLLSNKIIWDNRFLITIDNSDSYINKLIVANSLSIKKFTLNDFNFIMDKLDYPKEIRLNTFLFLKKSICKSILFTFPVIKSFKKIIAIPHISYYDSIDLDGLFDIIFKPRYISRFVHFL